MWREKKGCDRWRLRWGLTRIRAFNIDLCMTMIYLFTFWDIVFICLNV